MAFVIFDFSTFIITLAKIYHAQNCYPDRCKTLFAGFVLFEVLSCLYSILKPHRIPLRANAAIPIVL